VFFLISTRYSAGPLFCKCGKRGGVEGEVERGIGGDGVRGREGRGSGRVVGEEGSKWEGHVGKGRGR